jgi:hypothetical protein
MAKVLAAGHRPPPSDRPTPQPPDNLADSLSKRERLCPSGKGARTYPTLSGTSVRATDRGRGTSVAGRVIADGTHRPSLTRR